MAAPGHEMPERKSNGTEVNTKMSIHVSRFLITTEAVREKNTHAKRKGTMNVSNVRGSDNCSRLNMRGTAQST